jgi:tetratricopeptide (TPR) repeat protein
MSRSIVLVFCALSLVFLVAHASVATILEQGEALVKAGKIDEALEHYEAHVKKNLADTDAAILGQVARLHFETQDYDATTKFIKQAFDAGVQDTTLSYYRARVNFDLRSEENMLKDLDDVLKANPNHIGANILKGMYLRGTIQEDEEEGVAGEVAEKDKSIADESARLVKVGLETNPTTADDYEQQAAGFMYEQDLDNCARIVEAAIALNPSRPPLYLIRCLIKVSQDEMEAGELYCQKASELARPGPIKEAVDSVIEILQYAKASSEGEEEDDEHDHHHHHHDHDHDHDHEDEDEDEDHDGEL